ncbi:MAG TPA: hypothetical protein VM367_13375 [Pseudonocardia sp.]|jgi:hypothetical protein|nr:hypothetical protein [Pseudonocardia sp.]
MIRICERCYGVIPADEPVLRLAHIDHARRDGTVKWRHSYLHPAGGCGVLEAPRRPAKRPDRGDWNPVRRGMSPTAEHWLSAARLADPTSVVR